MSSQMLLAVAPRHPGNCILPSKWFHEQRRAGKGRSRGKFVERDEFCNLLLSFRKVTRCDEFTTRGLLDMATGERFLIQEEKLFER